MKKIFVTVGISNSGKSTWAHEQWAENPEKYIIVNRDKIRELLFGFTEPTIYKYYHTAKIRDFEKEVTRYEDTLINEALQSGKMPIVDATHLSRKYLERFKYWNVPVEVKYFPIMLKEAEIRNVSRERQVPSEVMVKQYNQFTGLMAELDKNPIDFTPVEFDNKPKSKYCFIYDIDGTLAHMDRKQRSPYDWHKVGLDTPDSSTATITDIMYKANSGVKVIICTGRDGVCLGDTKRWLEEYDIPYDKIHIRPEGDQRPDWVVKEEMWREIAKEHYIVGMFDDRLQVVRRARALGLKVFNVEYNNF